MFEQRPMTDDEQRLEAERAADIHSGEAAAAFVAGGIGIFILGLNTTLAAASEGIADLFRLSEATGPLSGKTTFAVAIWLIAWVVMGFLWRNKEMSLRTPIIISLVLVALGFVLTFPPVFEAFAPAE